MISPIRTHLWGFLESLYSNELTSESPKAGTPSWITRPLLDHQRSTLAAALALEKAKSAGIEVPGLPSDPLGGTFYTSCGILGDRVGSGKSLTALALMKQPPPPSHYVEYVTQQASADGRAIGLLRTRSQLVTRRGAALTPTTASLLIVPHALVEQWVHYIQRDTTLRVCTVKRKADALEPTFLANLAAYDVVIVSSTMWGTFKDYCRPTENKPAIRSILWQRVFIDEADSVSFHNDPDELHGLFYWFISASWLNLVFCSGASFNMETQYAPPPQTPPRVVEQAFRSVIHPHFSVAGCRHKNIVRQICGINSTANSYNISIASSQIARLVLRASDEFVMRSFTMPAPVHTILSCRTPTSLRVLSSFLSPDLMERLHAGDVLGGLATVGMSSCSEDEIINVFTDSWAKELEAARRTHEFKKTMEYSSDAAKAKAMETCEAKIASLQNRIAAVQERVKRAKEDACAVCYSESENPALTPCCQQVFCFRCICETLQRTSSCPLCRASIRDIKTVKVLGATTVATATAAKTVEAVSATGRLGKRETAFQWISAHADARILVFSSYDASFAGFDLTLTIAGISNAVLMGSQARVAKLLREFKEGTHRVLFLNARNMGAGLNIDCATHVLLFHKMPQELEKQIIGRAVRLGRTAPLEVVHLLHENESRSPTEGIITHV